MPKTGLYEQDFYAWATEQAALLRSGRLAAADIDNIAEEIESMGRSEKRELSSRLTVLVLHLLKWQFQPMMRGPSGRATIRIQRHDLADHLADNPSLRSRVPDLLPRAYDGAVIRAGAETGLPESTFPVACPWSFAQMMDAGFWPDGGS